ncbi:MAG TPA: LysR family transcriptional regulator [Candidatus Onthocola gallistercoris]|uniref:LysR family transcriptional regulator n=1 Tax=Candidatus Onthocola gallistercoris TaxID=2840876 RepID=A0A9D1KX92_9FIRM|nr:LysR family transcriptional regulator [Candidatus Onthocola gallistercoris]
MDIRVLKYFLMVAREENITKAASLLHVTQPTLSRQLIQLEEELGVKLFIRGKHRIILTDDGMLLKRRAQEIVSLTDKTIREFTDHQGELAGEISIGCGETKNMTFISERMAAFRSMHPLVHFSIYSAIADDIRERIEKGLLDAGLMMGPTDIGKYEFIHMPYKEKWGILTREDSPLASKDHVTPDDLIGFPLIMPWREDVRSDLASWFGDRYDRLDVAATYNLVTNAANMVKNQVGSVLCLESGQSYNGLRFVPLCPQREAWAILAWKKNQPFSPAASKFLKFCRDSCASAASDPSDED